MRIIRILNTCKFINISFCSIALSNTSSSCSDRYGSTASERFCSYHIDFVYVRSCLAGREIFAGYLIAYKTRVIWASSLMLAYFLRQGIKTQNRLQSIIILLIFFQHRRNAFSGTHNHAVNKYIFSLSQHTADV